MATTTDLRTLRLSRQYTQREIARRVGCSRAVVSLVERAAYPASDSTQRRWTQRIAIVLMRKDQP